MKKFKIENLLHSKGYVSIETLIVAGLIIATGAFLTSKLVWKGKDVANSNNNNMINAGKTMDDNSFSNNISTDSSSQVQEAKHSVENPSDLSDFDYVIIDDNYINGELKKIDEKTSKKSGPFAPPPEAIARLKAPIENLRKFKGKVMITGYHGNKTDIEIPSYINGKEVTVIAPMAFVPKSPDSFMTKPSMGKLTSVKLPNTLKFIGDNAFAFNQLTEITIPDSVTEIGGNSFFKNKLSSIKLGCNVKKIGKFSFNENQLESVIIPDSVVEIGSSAFQKNKLTSIKLGSNLKDIEDFAFAYNKLETVIVPDNVTSLGYCVFLNNPLKSKVIPKTCKEAETFSLKID
ncbi:leucine-rich repeat domain-containing protein [Clostridium perfringens]|uniref:Leucine-rich cell surface protein n=1 Tax=Clostridium perfringens TaxID=1502 RepID=A0A140GRW6_CLOPF|nr:leucine-rich repeat domain-containing protein [Clostridium perfringens]AMN31275.1 leucine-rich cell surface protein [Clostridium perfringens]